MLDIIKSYWPYLLGLFLLVGHVPIRALVKPIKTTWLDSGLAIWESVTVDFRKAFKALGKPIPWLEPVVRVLDAIAPIPANDSETTPVPSGDPTTKPITIELPPEPPRAA